MAKCATCSADQDDASVFCQSCGSRMKLYGAHESNVPSPPPLSGDLNTTFQVRPAASGVVSGPYSEPVLHQYINQGTVSITDSLWDPSIGQWTMISRSRFAPAATAAASYVRVATSTCPQCGSPLVATVKRSTAGLVLIIVGFVLTPMFGIGVPIWIIGFAIRFGGKGKLRLRCARCQYTAP